VLYKQLKHSEPLISSGRKYSFPNPSFQTPVKYEQALLMFFIRLAPLTFMCSLHKTILRFNIFASEFKQALKFDVDIKIFNSSTKN
jgi:hypothetical protein